MPSINWNMAIRRGTALSLFTDNTVLMDEEIGVESDTRLFKLGDGVTAWNDLPYSSAVHANSIWIGLSADVGNLLEVSSTDHGFKLDPAKLNALSAFDQAYAGTIVDLLNYEGVDQHKAAAVRAGILLRAVVTAMGANYTGLLSGGVPSTTVTAALTAIQDQITAMNGGGAHISDSTTTATETWSSNKINSEIGTALASLVDSSPAALNTLAELATALGNNPNFATTVANELGNCVKIVSQSLSDAQKAQVKTNLGIVETPAGIIYTTHTTNYLAKDKDGVLANTNGGGFMVLLPANPVQGYQVFLVDSGDWSVNNLILGCNGTSIENLLEDVTLNIKGVSIQAIFDGVTWKLYAQSGTGYSAYVSTVNGVSGPVLLKTINNTSLVGSGNIKVGLLPTDIQTSAYSASIGELVRVNSTGGVFTVTAPTGAMDGDCFGIFDVANKCTSLPVLLSVTSGVKVEGDASGLFIDSDGAHVVFMYNTATSNWKIQATPLQASGILGIDHGGTGSATQAGALIALGAQEAAKKDATGGFAGLTGWALNLKNAAGTIMSFISSAATATRTWVMPDKSGTVALLDDITGGILGCNFSSINGGPLGGFRNRIINGDMRVAQRGASYTLTTSPAYGSLDRWAALSMGATTATFSQVTGSGGFNYFARLGRTAGSAATTAMYFGGALETLNVTDLQGKAATLSFYAKAGTNFSAPSSNMTVQVNTGTGADQSVMAMNSGTWSGFAAVINATQPITTSLTRYSFQVTLPAGCTQIGYWFGYSTTGTAGADDNLYVTGIQLEIGTVATPFEFRPYSVELAMCQRYYEIGGAFPVGNVTSGFNFGAFCKFTVAKRATPTITQTNTSASNVSATTNNANGPVSTEGFLSYRVATATTVGQYTETWTAAAEL